MIFSIPSAKYSLKFKLRPSQYIPPVTKKYESRTIEKMVIADGWCNHEGCLILKFGTSNTKNGNEYSVSNIFLFSLREMKRNQRMVLYCFWGGWKIDVGKFLYTKK